VLAEFAVMPLMGPMMTQTKPGFLWNRQGVLSSGRCDTSVAGTLINVVRLWLGLHERTGLSYADLAMRLGRTWDYMIWGDDTVIVMPEAWRNKGEKESGFTLESVPDVAVFLAKNWLPSGRNHALLSRMYINTINKEERNEPRSDVIAVLGVLARLELLKEHPKKHLFGIAMRARPKTRRIWDLASQMSLQEIERALLKQIAKDKVPLVVLEGIEQDLAEIGWDQSLLTEAIAESLGRHHAFGPWDDETADMDVSEAVKTLIEIGDQAP
jgi:hypothetical protein